MSWNDIPGATDTTYTTPPLDADNNGEIYRSVADTGFVEYESNEAYTWQRKHTVQYAIELYSSSTLSDYTRGITVGVFRWITGRPGYGGIAPQFPLWEDGTSNTEIWYEGFITKDGMSNPSRQIDLDLTGDYGTISGFNFSIENTNKFWEFLESNDIFVVNRIVKVYAVLGDKFYQIWDGVVTDLPYNETLLRFTCKDSFRTLHKFLPPDIVSATTYEDAPTQSDPIPVSFGDIAYAKLTDIQSTVTYETLFRDLSGNDIKLTAAKRWSNSFKTVSQLSLHVPFTCNIAHNQFLDYYLFKNGESKGIRIIGNTAPQMDGLDKVIVVHLAEQLSISGEEMDPDDFSSDYALCGGNGEKLGDVPANAETWWFKIAKIGVRGIISEGDIDSIELDDSGIPIVYYYSADDQQYYRMESAVTGYSATGDAETPHPFISFAARGVNEDSSFPSVFALVPKIIEMTPSTYPGDGAIIPEPSLSVPNYSLNNFIDKDRNTYNTYKVYSPIYKHVDFTFTVDVHGLDTSKVDQIYFAADFTTENINQVPTSGTGLLFDTFFRIYDVYGNEIELAEEFSGTFPGTYGLSSTNTKIFNFLPREYYDVGGDTADEGDYFLGGQYALCLLSDEIKNFIKSGVSSTKIEVVFRLRVFDDVQPTTNPMLVNGLIKFKQMGLFSVQTVSLKQGTVYTKIKGEKDPTGAETNNVYRIFKTMLETYDGLTADQIDYANLQETRESWGASRQITERKNTFDYLKELAQQSFVAMYPTRTGKRRLVAWREIDDTPVTHSEATIVRDSIEDYKKTQIERLYNHFYLQYSWDPGAGKYARTFFVDKVEQAALPDVAGSWGSYMGGLGSGSYASAKVLWDICHRSYDTVNVISQDLPKSLSELPWYYDPKTFDEDATEGIGINNSAYKYLVNLVEWTSKQKDVVSYRIPMTETNIITELVDPVSFSDAIYTNNQTRSGWITRVEIDTKNDEIVVTTLLEPYNIENVNDGLIIERGTPLNDGNLIIESGSQPDIIVERGV